jgi:hypothetical protein
MLVGTGLLQVLFTNAALRVCDTLTTLPIGFSFYSLMAFINSLVWYNSWSLFTWWEYLLNGLGIALNVCGVFVLSIRRPIGSGYDLLATGSASEADGDDECGDDGSDSDETVDLLSDSGNTATDTKSLLYTPTASMNCRKLSNNGAQNSDPQHVSPHKRWLPSVAAAAAILSPPPALHRSVSPTAAALSSSAASSSHHTTTTSTTTNTVNSGTTIATNS